MRRREFIALVGTTRRILRNHRSGLAAKSHLPAMYAAREFADAGGLMLHRQRDHGLNSRCR
jgi:hypothetical protein